jgi:hypothetical protein
MAEDRAIEPYRDPTNSYIQNLQERVLALESKPRKEKKELTRLQRQIRSVAPWLVAMPPTLAVTGGAWFHGGILGATLGVAGISVTIILFVISMAVAND